ncbi:hypothetical protein [Asticcacaulis excentricus]|uniref:Uncharacterized protein n=1 Tax=Asticcacaulis excentricus (strain ATCC 15261 / DSM 4724 / KCTC 12464 / NCIMB 9791 / VKM B-1370 / CB 48) TaxID=573065 RepID=E8RR13_ASTEC|nr:hypothetical protein [Asticcacaulis excentricus]ADU13331.1 hypothetical protein Astex_1665 [Asticcacaulis excentricus CB 48]
MRFVWTIGFSFTGFFLISNSLLQTVWVGGMNGLWMFLLSGGAVIVGLMANIWVAAVGVILNLALRYLFGDVDLIWDAVAFAAGLCLFFIGSSYRCPRCELSLIKNTWNRWSTASIPNHCTVCGRTRADVRPFQYALCPEPWDGQYHDEGGGPFPTDLDVADMALYHAQKRYKKKQFKKARR